AGSAPLNARVDAFGSVGSLHPEATAGVCAHVPLRQTSLVQIVPSSVQTEPSGRAWVTQPAYASHVAVWQSPGAGQVTVACTQPTTSARGLPGSHVSVVQTLPSSHSATAVHVALERR